MRYSNKTGMAMAAAVMMLGMCTVAWGQAETEEILSNTALTLGTKAGETDYAVEVTNATGLTITSAAIRVDGNEYGDELLPEGETFDDGEMAMLYCTPKELAPGATSAPRYDIRLIFDDGEVAVIHTLPFGDADSVEILFDDEEMEETETQEGETEEVPDETEAEEDPLAQTVVAYLKFTSKSLGSEQNTCQHERDTLNPPAVDYSAYTDYSYSDYTDYSYSDYSYDSSSDISYEAPVYADGGNADDQCGTDGILN